MADSSQGPAQNRLPIKLIMPKQGTERKVTGGGSAKKPFGEVTREYRSSLLNQVNAVEKTLSGPLKSLRVAPVRVTVIPKASAKSHRPDNLFSDKTCPIIGAGGLGELFVKATPDGLSALKSMIERNQSEAIVKALSLIPNFTSEKRHEQIMINSIKELGQIHIHSKATSRLDDGVNLLNRLFRTTLWPEAKTTIGEVWVKQRR